MKFKKPTGLVLITLAMVAALMLFANKRASAVSPTGGSPCNPKGPRATGFLYGATAAANLGGELVIINPATGAVSRDIGPLMDQFGNQYGITGLAFNSAGVLYGSTSNHSATAPQSLVTIDPLTARVTPVGSFGAGPNTMADLTFDATTGTLYGTSSFGANLYTINQGTGAATLVGPSGYALVTQGSASAGNDEGTVYGTPIGASGDLVTYDKTTGFTTIVGTLSGAPFPAGAVNALAFNDGVLLGVNVDLSNPSSRPTDVVRIDTTTGIVSDIGPSINNLDAIALAPSRVAGNLCKQGGWQTLSRADGSGFKNQGDCIQYVNTGK